MSQYLKNMRVIITLPGYTKCNLCILPLFFLSDDLGGSEPVSVKLRSQWPSRNLTRVAKIPSWLLYHGSRVQSNILQCQDIFFNLHSPASPLPATFFNILGWDQRLLLFNHCPHLRGDLDIALHNITGATKVYIIHTSQMHPSLPREKKKEKVHCPRYANYALHPENPTRWISKHKKRHDSDAVHRGTKSTQQRY